MRREHKSACETVPGQGLLQVCGQAVLRLKMPEMRRIRPALASAGAAETRPSADCLWPCLADPSSSAAAAAAAAAAADAAADAAPWVLPWRGR